MAINWYAETSRAERRTFWACLGGYTLDSLDSQMYALLAPVLITLVGFTKPEIGELTTTGLMGNALGGWIAGIAADRLGRKRLLQITIYGWRAFRTWPPSPPRIPSSSPCASCKAWALAARRRSPACCWARSCGPICADAW